MNVDELSAADVIGVHLLKHFAIVFWNVQLKFVIGIVSICLYLLKIEQVR